MIFISFPGLFKIEWQGDGLVGLAAKTFYCYNISNPEHDKYSAKGVNRIIKLTRDHYLSVLKTQKPVQSTNKGFIMKNRELLTYSMNKDGLS